VRAAEMKLKQNILVDLRLEFCSSFISVLFLFHFCFISHVQPA
jgi:hypothetical protein